MAKVKKSKEVSTKASSKKGSVKKALKPGLGAKTLKILERQRVSSKGLSSVKKAKFNVSVVMNQVKEVRGFLAEETNFDISIKGRVVSGKGRKPHFNVIDRKDIIAYEGAKGEPCKVLVNMPVVVASYTNCTYIRKSCGLMVLTNEAGETISLVTQPGVNLEIAAVIEEK